MGRDRTVDGTLSCREAIALFGDFLEAALGPTQLSELERHLAGCEPCQAYLATYRRTRELTAETERVEMPPEMRKRLADFLLRALASEG